VVVYYQYISLLYFSIQLEFVNMLFFGDFSFEIINGEMNFISYNMLFNFNNDTIIRMNIFLHKLMKFVME